LTRVAHTHTDGFSVAALSGQLTIDDDALLAELAGLLSEQPEALIVDLTELSIAPGDTLELFEELERMARDAMVPLGFTGA
jgi:hypothetical protein